jgi:dTDP-4-dehydrorhamnose reductase
MRVLITGAEGQIGRALRATTPPGVAVRALGRSQLDLTRQGDIALRVHEFRPDLVVNAAGYTAVDRAEAEPAAAGAVNEEGACHLAEVAAETGARMLHFSTDYVFDGKQGRPYGPGDPPNPLNVYGRSKLAGERAVLDALGDRAVVVRTAWVYAATGRNFLRTMLRLLNEREQVRVVSDQLGTPTSAASVARAAWAIAGHPDLRGIAHWTDDGVASWYDFAVAIQEEALQAGLLGRAAKVVPVATEEYPSPACRPRYSVLDCSAARAALQLVPDHWRVALRRTLGELTDG